MSFDYEIVIKEKVMPAVFGGIAIFLVTVLMDLTFGSVILFASLGSSAVILSEFPDTRMAKLRVVILAYAVAMLIGFICSTIPYLPAAAGLSVFLTITAMMLANVVHPPAGGAALAFLFQSRAVTDLEYMMLAVIILLVILKFIIHVYKKEYHIKKFRHEFFRENPGTVEKKPK